jgi:hypothetical protein
MPSMVALLASDEKRLLGATMEIYASAGGAAYLSPARERWVRDIQDAEHRRCGTCPCADGKTCKEALANVEIVIQEWIETAKELGRPIPAPRGRLAFA